MVVLVYYVRPDCWGDHRNSRRSFRTYSIVVLEENLKVPLEVHEEESWNTLDCFRCLRAVVPLGGNSNPDSCDSIDIMTLVGILMGM